MEKVQSSRFFGGKKKEWEKGWGERAMILRNLRERERERFVEFLFRPGGRLLYIYREREFFM